MNISTYPISQSSPNHYDDHHWTAEAPLGPSCGSRCERERQRLRAEVEALSQKLAAQEEELAAGGDGVILTGGNESGFF